VRYFLADYKRPLNSEMRIIPEEIEISAKPLSETAALLIPPFPSKMEFPAPDKSLQFVSVSGYNWSASFACSRAGNKLLPDG
jgi:hypothetical protein